MSWYAEDLLKQKYSDFVKALDVSSFSFDIMEKNVFFMAFVISFFVYFWVFLCVLALGFCWLFF